MFFLSCEDVVYNDLGIQGEWEKDCEIEYQTRKMRIKIDNDTLYYRRKDVADWQEAVQCDASFGVMYLNQNGKKSKGAYFSFFTYLSLSSFSADSGFIWLNGYWVKM